jgi:kumamolisin
MSPLPPSRRPRNRWAAFIRWAQFMRVAYLVPWAVPVVLGWGAIALVDAYDNPDAASDIMNFSSFWGLPAPGFVKVYANGNGDCQTPAANAGWSVESSLDIEWAHVMAPDAVIILVEACTNSFTDLFYAEQVATEWVASYGGGAVSNSWGGGEFAGQTAYDSYFSSISALGNSYAGSPIVYFASAGDGGCGAQYPSTVPWLVSAGGTSVLRKSTTGAFSSESCWGGSGGGTSAQETYTTTFSGGNVGPWANYQQPIFGTGNRATPDMSFNADPNSGVWVLSQYGFTGCSGLGCYGVVGGTSVSSPALAGIVNHAGNKLGAWTGFAIDNYGYYNAEEDNLIYSQLGTALAYKTNFYDVKTGSNTSNTCASKATTEWDYCTGVGSPRGLLGK